MTRRKRSLEHAALRRKWRLDGTYERLLADQKGLCGICHKPPRPGEKLDIDHDHAKGKDQTPRGLLHRGCNLRLGRESDWRWMAGAAEYLFRYEQREAA